MATINIHTDNPTLLDLIKMQDPDGSIADMAELLTKTNLILEDMVWMPGNLTTGHRISQRTGLPTVYWRALNEGVPASKSTYTQVDEVTGEMSQYDNADEVLAKLSGNVNKFRLKNAMGVLEAMNQEMATTLFYGAKVDSKKFIGFSPRYSSYYVAGTTEDTIAAFNVIHGGGSGADNTSIWFVTWGDSRTFGITPKHLPTGLKQIDKGLQTVQDASGNDYEAYKTQFQWFAGLAVEDWRYNARVCNIDVSDLDPDASSGAKLVDLMITAYYRIPYGGAGGRMVIYCNRVISEFLHKQAMNKTNINLTLDTYEGRPITKFLGVPVKRVDAITEAEALVPADT